MALFPRKDASRPQFDAPLTPEVPVIVLGDVHGRIDLLDKMLARLVHLAHPSARFVCVGDYVDRGDDGAAVLRRLMALQQEAPAGLMTCLMGNHEDMLLAFLDTPETAGPRWMRHGGLQTLASFQVGLGNQVERDWPAIRDALRAAMGQELETWLRGLPTSWQTGNLFVAHAGADPTRPISDQSPRGLLWGAPTFYDRPRRDGIWVCHGHVITEPDQMVDGRIPIDTGAYATGCLTAAVIEPGQVNFLHT